MIDLTLADGKYRVRMIMGKGKYLEALRDGEEWRDLTGDNLILSLATALQDICENLDNLDWCAGYELVGKKNYELLEKAQDSAREILKGKRT